MHAYEEKGSVPTTSLFIIDFYSMKRSIKQCWLFELSTDKAFVSCAPLITVRGQNKKKMKYNQNLSRIAFNIEVIYPRNADKSNMMTGYSYPSIIICSGGQLNPAKDAYQVSLYLLNNHKANPWSILLLSRNHPKQGFKIIRRKGSLRVKELKKNRSITDKR